MTGNEARKFVLYRKPRAWCGFGKGRYTYETSYRAKWLIFDTGRATPIASGETNDEAWKRAAAALQGEEAK